MENHSNDPNYGSYSLLILYILYDMKYLMAGIELDLAGIKASYLPKWQALQNP